MIIEAGLTRYEAVNKEIEKQLEKQNKVTVKDVNGQRYIGCALDEGKTIEVYGTPGNDMACYLNGGRVIVYGTLIFFGEYGFDFVIYFLISSESCFYHSLTPLGEPVNFVVRTALSNIKRLGESIISP